MSSGSHTTLSHKTDASFTDLKELTLEVDLQATELQLHTLQGLPHSLMMVAYGLLRALAEGQGEVLVSLLAVVVRPHCVHP